MRVYLLVEGNSDVALFKRLLPPEIEPETTVATAGERSNITSKARSLMVTKRRPLALVTDADAVEKEPSRADARFCKSCSVRQQQAFPTGASWRCLI
jgi:hypothetical protein